MAARDTVKEWAWLTELLQKTMDELQRRKAHAAQKLLIECVKRSGGFGYARLARAAKAELMFLKERVLPDWDEERLAALSFSLGALLERMQQEAPGPHFDSGLPEILSFLDVLEELGVAVKPEESQKSDRTLSPGEVGHVETLSHADSVQREHQDMERVDSQRLGPAASPSPSPYDPAFTEDKRAHPADVGGDSDYVIDRADWYQEVLREDPSSILFCDLAEELCARGEWQEAVMTLRGGLYHHPRHVRGYALLGWALWEYGSAEESEKALTLARQEIEKCAVVYKVLNEILTHRGAISEANRMDTIYTLMTEGKIGTDVQWSPVPVSSMEDRPEADTIFEDFVVETEEGENQFPGLVTFLSALRDSVGMISPPEPSPVILFSASDRKTLEGLIHAQSGTA